MTDRISVVAPRLLLSKPIHFAHHQVLRHHQLLAQARQETVLFWLQARKVIGVQGVLEQAVENVIGVPRSISVFQIRTMAVVRSVVQSDTTLIAEILS